MLALDRNVFLQTASHIIDMKINVCNVCGSGSLVR